MMNTPGTAVLEATFSVEPFGGDVVNLADINGDGKPELLILQTAGQLRSQVNGSRGDIDQVDRDLYCLTAVDMRGNVLWQDGAPYDREMPFTGHGGDDMLLIDDINAGGRMEVAVVRRNELAILDAATGGCKRSKTLPSDNMVSLCSAQLGAAASGRHIVCKVNDESYPPWEYANPVMVFNPDLSVFRAPFAVRGAGHNMVAADINGDGHDELFIGYTLFDRDLNETWRLDLGAGFDYARDHADRISLSDVNCDGRPEVCYAGSEDFFVTDLSGNMLWKAAAGHSQTSIAGNWGPNAEKRIIMNEKNRGVAGMDHEGNIIWNRTDINGYAIHNVKWHRAGTRTEWPLFRPQLKPVSDVPCESDPAASRSLWPVFLDGDGSIHDVFPWRDAYAQPKRLIRAARSYDCGVKYDALVADINRDGMDEVVVFDRSRVWIFRNPV